MPNSSCVCSKKTRKSLAAHLCCPAKQPWQALTDMNFKKGDVIIRQGWGSQSPTNRLKLHQTTSMFHRRFVSWKFHGGWNAFFVFVGLYSRTWKWYPRSLCTRGWWLQSDRFFYHLLLRKKCHMTIHRQFTGYRRRMWSPLQVRPVILSTFSLMERSDCVVKVMKFVSSITMYH